MRFAIHLHPCRRLPGIKRKSLALLGGAFFLDEIDDSNQSILSTAIQYQTSAERQIAMTWAQRLKRVFDIDGATCSECGGDVRIIASIEDTVLSGRYLRTWIRKGHFLEIVCCGIAGLRQAHQWICWFERISPSLVLTYRPQLW